MFSRKTKELIKAGSISKKSRSGCAAPNSSLSVLQEQPYRDASDGVPSDLPNPSSSCPGTPLAQHTKLGPDGPPAADALKRSAPLSRHSSAAGFPLQSWVLSKGLGKGTFAHGSIPEGGVAAAIEVEDIPQLLCDVARFAKAMEMLKDVVLRDGKLESRRSLAHEFLGEGLRVLRLVISTYPLLSTVETLTAAGKLISKVKGFRYERCNEADKKDFEKAIENIAVAFSSNVSELLMGEVDSNTLLSLLPRERSRSMDNLYRGMRGLEGDIALGESDPKHCTLTAEEVDIILQCGEGGVDSALAYAKAFSKYMKDVVNYVEKRIALEAEFARGLQRVYQSCKQSFEQFHMPFISMYSQALEQDLEQSLGVLQATNTLHSQTFLQPLLQRRLEHERKRRETREQWQRAKRKLMEAETNLRKAKQAYMARREEYDKAKTVASRAEGEGSSSSAKSLDRKRRQEEETRNKAEEAEATYRTCSADATTQHQELEDVKVSVLQQLQELIRQSDQTLRCATVSYFQTMHMQTVALPVHYQALCETSKLYNLGQQYAFYVKDLGLIAEPEVHYDFEPYTTSSSQSSARAHKESFNTECQNNGESSPCSGGLGPGDGVSTAKETQSNRRGHKPNKSWPSTGSDTDSVDGSSGLGSPSTSTGDVRKMARTLSTGTTSSTDELIEKDKDFSTSEQSMNGVEAEIAVPTGPFRNVGLSKAAQTHRLRKLRTPAKCRECDSYVYFQGAECEECFLACHKKCLETLAIQCGHKKLQGRLQLFGRDFSKVSRGDSLGIPFIIKKCISEIERRALKMKGIYRVNGVKTRVEKMCQAFENGMELVELSQASPHDVSNVLKLYLRQLPEPIIPFRLYSGLMGLAKESLQAGATEEGESGKGFELVDLGPETDPDVLVMVDKLRDVLKELPRANVATLGYIVRHLCRVAEFEQENKMTPSNLGIVFGPALMRPRPTGATVSLSSLMDYPHQARIVEMLVVYHHAIFPSSSSVSDPSSTAQRSSQDHSTDGRVEEPGQEGTDRNSWQDPSVKTEVFVNSVGSYGSCEQSLDSDSDLEQTGSANRNKLSHCARQDSETSTEDDGLSSRGSLDLLSQSPPHPVQEQLLVTDGHPPAALNSEHPDLELSELKLASSPELNVNNSNNRAAWAPAALPVVRVSGGMLAMRDEEREPAFV